MKKRRKKRRRYKIKNILMLIIVILLIIKLTSVLINSGKDNKNEVVKSNEPKTYLNKVSKTDNYNDDIDKDIQNGVNVKVVNTTSTWMGMTYKEDKKRVSDFILNEIEMGIYPNNLWK